MDTRTLRELYLTAFEIAVKESMPRTVMCSYNKINGIYSSDNHELLTQILRDEWGFDGLVVTDWGAMHDRTAGFKAGCDLMMPGGSAYGEKAVIRAVREGQLSESLVDQCAARMIELALDSKEIRTQVYDPKEHHDAACEVAENSIVLLKNEDHILPLQKYESVAIIGYMASSPRYQGAGSSHIQPARLSCLTDEFPDAPYAPGCDAKGNTTPELLAEAKRIAGTADKVIVLAGLTDDYESEGFDRTNMKMPDGHIQMIEQVAEANPNVIVVLCCGSVVEIPWESKVKGILFAGLSGQAGAEALAKILRGSVNPSGRLAETWPMQYEDCPSHSYYGENFKDGQYREGIYVGYRYYEKANVPVRYPFGYGLSYTKFTYKNLTVNGNTVSVDITNTGHCTGKEAVLCYIIAPQDGIYRPLRELKRFTKLELQPGKTETVRFTLDDRCFAVWNDGWVVPEGTYEVEIGNLRAEIEMNGKNVPVPSWQPGSWYEKPYGIPTISDWQNLIGYTYAEQKPVKGQYSMENTIMEMWDHSFVMKIMYKAVESTIAKGFGGKKDYSDPNFKMMMASASDCSMSSSQINGAVPDGIMQGMVEMANGRYIKGLIRMIQGE